MLGLCCCAGFSLVAASGGYSLTAVCTVPIAAASCCGAQARGCADFSGCGTRAQQLWFLGSRARAQQLRHMGLVALQHVGSFQIRDRTHVSCIGRRILYHGATREAQRLTYLFQLVFKNKTFILNPWFHGHYCLGQTSWGWYSIDQLRFGASWSSQICHIP